MFTAFSGGLEPSPEARPEGQCGDTGLGCLLPVTVPVDLLTSIMQETVHRRLDEGTNATWFLVSQIHGTLRKMSKETQLAFPGVKNP